MCTAMSFTAQQHYFGRTLDLDYRHEENVIIMPRRYPVPFRRAGTLHQHFAMIGIAYAPDGMPPYYDATNEHGLSMAGLNFPKNALYGSFLSTKENIAPFELIPYILGSCENAADVKAKLSKINVIHCDFSEQLPTTPLHWLISDKNSSLTL